MTGCADTLVRLARDGTEAVLVTIAGATGSTPRAAGTKMLVTASRIHGTIGGGHLEYKAMAVAREMLGSAGHRVERFPLGPALGQCCGGHATLLFEAVPQAEAWDAWRGAVLALEALDEPGVLVTAGETEGPSRKLLVTAAGAFGGLGPRDVDDRAIQRARTMLRAGGEAFELSENLSKTMLFETIFPDDFNVVVFGAGHVGRAVVAVLAGLPCRITWIDEREDAFPTELPGNVATEVSAAPEQDVAAAPAGGFFLVVTHSHQLDLRLCERILRRGDFRYLGLIGSATKRARFEKRLAARGLPAETVARLTCPIGIPGISGKHPAEIAVAVAAEILRCREAEDTMTHQGSAERVRSA